MSPRRRRDARRRPRFHRDGTTLAAFAITLALHAWLLACLRQASTPQVAASDRGRTDVLAVVWIERPEASGPAPTERAPSHAPALSSPRADAIASAESRAIATSSPDAAPQAATAVPQVVDDVWQPVRGRRASRASDIDPSAFRRDPLARRDTLFDPPPARMEDAIEDRSFGGWMQGAGRKRQCADLRAQLGRAPESTYTIIESMRRRGCKV